MDPVTQTLAQQQSGTAQGEGFGSYFVQGRQLGLAQKRLALEERQVKMQERESDMLLLLRQKVLKLQAANLGAEAIVNIGKAEVVTESNMALTEINALKLRIMRSPLGAADPSIIDATEQLSLKYGMAFAPGAPGADLMTEQRAATMRMQQFKEMREMNSQLTGSGLVVRQLSPNIELSADPKMGIESRERIAVTRNTLLEQGRKVREDLAAKRIDNETARLQLGQIGMQLRQVSQQMDAHELGYEIDNMPVIPAAPIAGQAAPVAAPAPDALAPATVAPAAPAPAAPTLRAVARPLTQATTTELQQKLTDTSVAERELDAAIGEVRANPDAFGPVGVGKQLVETGRGILDPNASTRVTNARHKAGLAFIAVARGLRTDTGNMSLYEQRKLAELGDIRRFEQNPAFALEQEQNIMDALIARKLRYTKELKRPVDETTLQRVRGTEMIELYRDGLLSDEDALKWHRMQNAPTP